MVQIGGVRAPSPVGELGNVEMTQALNIVEPHWQGIGPDMLLTGYLPASGGLEALDAALSGQPSLLGQSAAHQQNGTSPSTSAPDLVSRGEARRQSHANVNKVACHTAAKAHHQGIRVCNDALWWSCCCHYESTCCFREADIPGCQVSNSMAHICRQCSSTKPGMSLVHCQTFPVILSDFQKGQ